MARLSLLAVVFLVGCGGSNLTKVSGVVTAKGTPVKFGTISLVPIGTGERAAAQIDENGRYELGTLKPGDGAAPGDYKVMIAAYKSLPAMGQPDSGKPAIAPKYFDSNSSGLTAKVVAGPPQVINFDLDLP